jgi:signal transduction histidine kinase
LNRHDALLALADPSATTRLRAARSLLENGNVTDLNAIRMARAEEIDSWTQRVLDRAAERLSNGGETSTKYTDLVNGQDGIPAAQTQAIQIATKRVLHEVRPILQSVFRAARADLGTDFEASLTRAALSRMGDLLDALQALGEAAQTPRNTQFDLSELVASQVNAEEFATRVLLARSDPILVEGDPSLVGLAIANLARNAVDASTAAQTDAPVVINWGRHGSEAWISVLDEGDGLPFDSFAAALEVGTTTRTGRGHFGLGLPIAVQAMQSLGGGLSLQPRKDGGTAAELRWPQ